MILQPHEGHRPGRHYLPASVEHVHWGWVPGAGTDPALVVDPGDTVTVDTISHEGILGDQGRDPVAFFGKWGIEPHRLLRDAMDLAASDRPHSQLIDGPHVITGPIAVRGAKPGDVVEVEVLDLARRADYGVISNRHGRGALPAELPLPSSDGSVPGVVSLLARVRSCADGDFGQLVPWQDGGPSPVFPLHPFAGLIAVALEDEAPIHSTAPGDHGGNLDVKDLAVGSSVLCPVRAPGGLVSFGDPHYAQGNGEVALTAFEAPLRVTVRLSLHRGSGVARLAHLIGRPFGDTGEHLVLVGLGADLDAAMADACRTAVRVLEGRWGIDRQTALAYLSAAADFDISQVVNGIKGVHCRIRHRDLATMAEGSSALL